MFPSYTILDPCGQLSLSQRETQESKSAGTWDAPKSRIQTSFPIFQLLSRSCCRLPPDSQRASIPKGHPIFRSNHIAHVTDVVTALRFSPSASVRPLVESHAFRWQVPLLLRTLAMPEPQNSCRGRRFLCRPPASLGHRSVSDLSQCKTCQRAAAGAGDAGCPKTTFPWVIFTPQCQQWPPRV